MRKEDILRSLAKVSDEDFEELFKQATADRKKLTAGVSPKDWTTLCNMYKAAASTLKATKNFEFKGSVELSVSMAESCFPSVNYHISHIDCDTEPAEMFIKGDTESVIKALFDEEIGTMQLASETLFKKIKDLAKKISDDPKKTANIESNIWDKLNDKFYYREGGVLKKHKDQW
jgi:flagellar capping protein FliD